jgi:uncharacterized protein YkwD
MYSSMRRPGGAWVRLLTGSVLAGGASLLVSACSGESPPGDATSQDPAADMGRAVTDMADGPAPAADNVGTVGNGDSTNQPDSIDEGQPRPSGLDDSGGTGDADAREQDGDGTPSAGQSSDVAATEYCAAVANWDPEWVQFEEEVLLLVNENRAKPADCGMEGKFAATTPLVMDPILRCSARLHSLDMFERDFFAHVNPDGLDPFKRMANAGFVGSGGGENIAVGQQTPEEVMEAWMDSDGHCANVMRSAFTTIGVGYHAGTGGRGLDSNFWTQNFGAPRGRAR